MGCIRLHIHSLTVWRLINTAAAELLKHSVLHEQRHHHHYPAAPPLRPVLNVRFTCIPRATASTEPRASRSSGIGLSESLDPSASFQDAIQHAVALLREPVSRHGSHAADEDGGEDHVSFGGESSERTDHHPEEHLLQDEHLVIRHVIKQTLLWTRCEDTDGAGYRACLSVQGKLFKKLLNWQKSSYIAGKIRIVLPCNGMSCTISYSFTCFSLPD